MTTLATALDLLAKTDAHLSALRRHWVAAPTSAQRSDLMGLINDTLDQRLVLMAARSFLTR